MADVAEQLVRKMKDSEAGWGVERCEADCEHKAPFQMSMDKAAEMSTGSREPTVQMAEGDQQSEKELSRSWSPYG